MRKLLSLLASLILVVVVPAAFADVGGTSPSFTITNVQVAYVN
jgi:hypothetical protein